jgi:hypothetical protein
VAQEPGDVVRAGDTATKGEDVVDKDRNYQQREQAQHENLPQRSRNVTVSLVSYWGEKGAPARQAHDTMVKPHWL